MPAKIKSFGKSEDILFHSVPIIIPVICPPAECPETINLFLFISSLLAFFQIHTIASWACKTISVIEILGHKSYPTVKKFILLFTNELARKL